MTPLVPAAGGALIVAGIFGLIFRRHLFARSAPGPKRFRKLHVSQTTKLLAAAGLAAGVLVALVTGWLIAIAVIPAAAVGLPILLGNPQDKARINKLDALEEWTRALSGTLTVGYSLEEAIRTSLRSAPDPIRPEVTRLVARLRARVGTEQALRAFADDIDDSTGDMVAAFLILGSHRRGQGLASVLETLAESVAADVRARRAIEADRAKPRTTARWVTIITVGVLAVLALSGDYIAPYHTPVGGLILIVLLAAYVALLLWMRQMAKAKPIPRFLGDEVRRHR